jgi:hypothetical protein
VPRCFQISSLSHLVGTKEAGRWKDAVRCGTTNRGPSDGIDGIGSLSTSQDHSDQSSSPIMRKAPLRDSQEILSPRILTYFQRFVPSGAKDYMSGKYRYFDLVPLSCRGTRSDVKVAATVAISSRPLFSTRFRTPLRPIRARIGDMCLPGTGWVWMHWTQSRTLCLPPMRAAALLPVFHFSCFLGNMMWTQSCGEEGTMVKMLLV